ncbi:hypothetical protein HN51_011501 [Arachis hypogaea]|uniref:Uncharacterized protein n=1 Tax=Arachis hypogaea TaxID=3818 RepID=A0A445DYQ5_ARAHY|nr:uncharacterized protein LOC112790010 isoform X2 [Arachis hypogaea]RYR68355.1 hypothetical protein Ahy_A03g014848 [Arachis hypogaea]
MEASKKNEIIIKEANNHWTFLEHIEAPMWVDLTIEANSFSEDINDDWFNTSHPFHQWSARQLKAKFSHPGQEKLTSEVVDSDGQDSQQVPSSVSRSRGKHYNSKKWGVMNLNNLLDKQQGLSKRCFQASSSFGNEVKPKTKSNVGHPKGLLSENLGPNFESKARGKAKSSASCSKPVIGTNFLDKRSGESSTRSTITSEDTHQQQKCKVEPTQPCDKNGRSLSDRGVGLRKSCITDRASIVQQQQKSMEVSSQPSKSGSSSAASVCLGKSCVTRRTSRMEVAGDIMQSRGRKSSYGNSSVGSSSIPGYEVKFVSKHIRKEIADGNDAVTMNLADKNNWKPANVSQRQTSTVKGAKSSNKQGNSVNCAKPACLRNTKSLVQYRSIRQTSLMPVNGNKEDACTGAKKKLGKINSLTGKGKENVANTVTSNPKCIEKGVTSGRMLKDLRTMERCHLQKGNTGSAAMANKLGKDNDLPEEKNRTNLVRRIYLR